MAPTFVSYQPPKKSVVVYPEGVKYYSQWATPLDRITTELLLVPLQRGQAPTGRGNHASILLRRFNPSHIQHEKPVSIYHARRRIRIVCLYMRNCPGTGMSDPENRRRFRPCAYPFQIVSHRNNRAFCRNGEKTLIKVDQVKSQKAIHFEHSNGRRATGRFQWVKRTSRI